MTPLALTAHRAGVILPAMPQDSLVRATVLWHEAGVLIASVQRTRAEIVAARRRCRIRRGLRLAVGANDDEAAATPLATRSWPETWARRCPRCQSGDVRPLGRVAEDDALGKRYVWCEVCHLPFVFVRQSRA